MTMNTPKADKLLHDAFVESECEVGGCMCRAWDTWWLACNEADPESCADDRDPAHLTDVSFTPAQCGRPDICRLYRTRTIEAAHDRG